MTHKAYLRLLIISLIIILSTVTIYIFYYEKNYPVPLTDNIYLDAKLKFIREEVDVDKVDTLIIGSSIGLNNIQGTYLEKYSNKIHHVLNLSVQGAYTRRTEQIFAMKEAFPALKRIIYSVQYTDLGITHQYKRFPIEEMIHYMKKELSPLTLLKLYFHACQNIYFCINRQKSWSQIHSDKSKFTALVFDATGSVPLDINKTNTDKGRWHGAQPGYMPEISYTSIDNMARKACRSGIKFYVVQNPYRQEIINRDARVKYSMYAFKMRMQDLVKFRKAHFFNLHDALLLSDEYFADRNHLNKQGSFRTALEVAKYVDTIE